QGDDLVGLMVQRSEWMIVGILGILKSGAAYVPIDPEYPEERINYILDDAAVKVLIVETIGLENKFFSPQTSRVYLDEFWSDVAAEGKDNPVHINRQTDLSYVIYTSGSSGRPKGVLIEHKNVVRLLFNDHFNFSFSEKDTWTVFHSICFDFSVWEIFGALLYGGKLVVVSRETALDPASYVELIVREKVTVLNQVPTVFKNLTTEVFQRQSLPELSLRYVIFGGEALNPASLRDWHEQYPHVKLVNMYGITETTVHVTYKELGHDEIYSGISNIGLPLPTLNLYLMDDEAQLVPIGVVGELVVGGDGVARGYLNRPALTHERFINNPYRADERLYRSGDLGMRTESGEIIYLGRRDFQVKIRGYRIEIGEIENVIRGYAGVEDVRVVSRTI
ncbi:amino acid adenylation domain-containing protein, partial [Chryseolinea lacunae]